MAETVEKSKEAVAGGAGAVAGPKVVIEYCGS